jgi:hypothetical protein
MCGFRVVSNPKWINTNYSEGVRVKDRVSGKNI